MARPKLQKMTPIPEPVLEPLKSAVDEAAKLFDPKLWFYDRVSRKGLPYDLMRACSCGCRVFNMVMRGPGDRDCHVVCQVCYKDSRYRLWHKNDIVYATLDVRTKRVTYTRPIAETIAMRAKMPKG